MTTFSPQPNNHISDADRELLSAYLDSELDAAEATHLEQRLEAEPALRHEYETLQATRHLLREMPPVVPPRSFTIDPATVRARRSWLFSGMSGFQFGGGLAAVLIAALVTTLALVGPGMGGSTSAPASEMARSAEDESAGDAVARLEPPPTPSPLATPAFPLATGPEDDAPDMGGAPAAEGEMAEEEAPETALMREEADEAEEVGEEEALADQPPREPSPPHTMPAEPTARLPVPTSPPPAARQPAGAPDMAPPPTQAAGLESSGSSSPGTQQAAPAPQAEAEATTPPSGFSPVIPLIMLLAFGVALGAWLLWRQRSR